MKSYHSDSDNETYYSYENDEESYYEYEEDEEPEQVFYLNDDEDEEEDCLRENEPTETKQKEGIVKNISCAIPEINPWTKMKQNETELKSVSTPKSFLEIMEEEAALEKKRKEAEEKKKQDALRFRRPPKKGNEKRHRNSNFNSNTSNKPAQSLLLSHKMNQKKV